MPELECGRRRAASPPTSGVPEFIGSLARPRTKLSACEALRSFPTIRSTPSAGYFEVPGKPPIISVEEYGVERFAKATPEIPRELSGGSTIRPMDARWNNFRERGDDETGALQDYSMEFVQTRREAVIERGLSGSGCQRIGDVVSPGSPHLAEPAGRGWTLLNWPGVINNWDEGAGAGSANWPATGGQTWRMERRNF